MPFKLIKYSDQDQTTKDNIKSTIINSVYKKYFHDKYDYFTDSMDYDQDPDTIFASILVCEKLPRIYAIEDTDSHISAPQCIFSIGDNDLNWVWHAPYSNHSLSQILYTITRSQKIDIYWIYRLLEKHNSGEPVLCSFGDEDGQSYARCVIHYLETRVWRDKW